MTTTTSTDPKESTAMTTTDTTDAGTEMTETDPAQASAPEGQADPSEGGKEGNKEAAKYRTQLRAAEAERDRLASAVATYQKRDVEALVGERLLSPADLWVGDATKLADLLAEDGTVDPAKVDAAVTKVLADHPHWAPPRKGVPRDLGQGRRGRASGPDVSWSDVFKG